MISPRFRFKPELLPGVVPGDRILIVCYFCASSILTVHVSRHMFLWVGYLYLHIDSATVPPFCLGHHCHFERCCVSLSYIEQENEPMALINCATLIFSLMWMASGHLQFPDKGDKVKMHHVEGKFQTCQEIFENGYTESGIYPLYFPSNRHKKKTLVYCNSTENQSGTIILYRYYGKENFTGGFNEYRNGFGSPTRDYWIGLDYILNIVAGGNSVLTIVMQDWYNNTRHARYQHFWLDPYPTYALHVTGFTGNVADDLSYHNGREFATVDRVDPYGCSLQQKAGWWYNYCAYSLLTGQYYYGGRYRPTGFYDGIYWKDWMGFDYSLKYVTMTLTPN